MTRTKSPSSLTRVLHVLESDTLSGRRTLQEALRTLPFGRGLLDPGLGTGFQSLPIAVQPPLRLAHGPPGGHHARLAPLVRGTGSLTRNKAFHRLVESLCVEDLSEPPVERRQDLSLPNVDSLRMLHRIDEGLADHPFDRNVFGMTRFPEDADIEQDPVAPILDVARRVCTSHGLEFHMASGRAISDDLWTNVAGHMWASRYGIAFFEDRLGRGVNYNLTIEVGAMIMTGRRCALIKDSSIERLPTDLVGRIYKEINLENLEEVEEALHTWVRDDLGLGPCETCR
jgi:hypothetical protein